LPHQRFKDSVCIKPFWRESLGGEPGNPTRRDSNFIAEVMDHMDGWKRGDNKINYGQYRSQNYWEKAEH